MSDPRPPVCVPTSGGHCSICGDEAVLARVIGIDPGSGTAEVTIGQSTGMVALDLLEDITLGDEVLVHMGFAIERVRGGNTG